MQTKPKWKMWIAFSAAGALFLLTAFLVIPSTSQAIFRALGIDSGKTYYNGFEPFTPFVPGYFPDDFDITYVNNEAIYSVDADTYMDTYTETYASAEYFFKLVESQGPGLPDQVPDADLTIQGVPASLSSGFDAELFANDALDMSTYNTSQGLVVSVVLKDITIQVVTNLPQAEAIQVAEGLIPAICTTKPTEPAN